MISRFDAKVVGLTFVDSYPDNIYALNRIAKQSLLSALKGKADGPDVWSMEITEDQTWLPEPIPTTLIRNPSNEHDVNAIEVHVPSLGDMSMIGHLPAHAAARVAPVMDEGVEFSSHIVDIRIHPDHPENPGITIHAEVADG